MKENTEPTSFRSRLYRQKWMMVAVGFLCGVFALGLVRFITYRDNSIHYHANFALYINGQQDEFKDASFYEEVASCSSNESDNPKIRAHLHDKNNHLVHVHDSGVTWGQLFANFGYTLGNNLVKNDKGVFINNQDGKKLTFTLNGKPVETIENKVIKSEDVLLINYGLEDTATQKQHYDAIPRDAGKANTTPDPAACSGSHAVTFLDRLKAAAGFPSSNP